MSQEVNVVSDEQKVAKILELRNAGYTWHQVDQMVFPGTTHEQSKKKSPSWHLAKKHNAPAFSKQVIGGWGPTQIVVKIRDLNPYRKAEVPATRSTGVTLADVMG